jgi:hypothetical protein
MILCPVCEHQQAAGSECEVCGRHLVEGRGTDAPVAPLEGLELTTLDPAGAAALPSAPVAPFAPFAPMALMEGLEVTAFAPAEEPLLAELIPDLEQTRAEAVEVSVDPTPDVERVLDGLPDDGPSLLPLVVTCRYCRTEAGPGERVCGRCGMRLPVFAVAAPTAAAGTPRLCSCGTPVTRSRCPACGARNATP